MSVPYARLVTPPLRGGSFPLPRAKDAVKTSVFTRPPKWDSSKPIGQRLGIWHRLQTFPGGSLQIGRALSMGELHDRRERPVKP